MSLKPYLGSGAYRGMDSAQAIAQYNRDLAQYEQAEAMQKLAKINEERLHQEEERLNELKRNEIQQMLSNDDSPYTGPTLVAINFYDEGTPEYEKYESIKAEKEKLENTSNTLSSISSFLLLIFLFILVTFWMILAINQQLALVVGIVVIIDIILCGIISNSNKQLIRKAQVLEDILLEMSDESYKQMIAKENRTRYTRKKLPKNSKMFVKRKATRKPKEFIDLTK